MPYEITKRLISESSKILLSRTGMDVNPCSVWRDKYCKQKALFPVRRSRLYYSAIKPLRTNRGEWERIRSLRFEKYWKAGRGDCGRNRKFCAMFQKSAGNSVEPGSLRYSSVSREGSPTFMPTDVKQLPIARSSSIPMAKRTPSPRSGRCSIKTTAGDTARFHG